MKENENAQVDQFFNLMSIFSVNYNHRGIVHKTTPVIVIRDIHQLTFSIQNQAQKSKICKAHACINHISHLVSK